MALAEIASIVPVISISIGILDIDIDLTRHTSTGNPITPTTSISTPKDIPTSNVATNAVTPTTTGDFVTVTTSPNTPIPGDRSTFAGSPTVSATEPNSLTTFVPGVSPTVLAASVSSVVGFSPQGTSAEGVGDATPFTPTFSGGIPVAAAEGFPTVAVTFDNESTIRPITGYPGTGFTSITGSSSTTSVDGVSSSNPQSHHGTKRLSPGIIVAIIITSLFILFGFIFFLCRRRRTRRDQDTVAWRTRSYGTNTFRRGIRSTLALPFHTRSRSTQEKISILSVTSPTSPTFLITPMAEASQSIPSILSDVSVDRHHDARLSTSSDGSATYSDRSFEDAWQTPVRPAESPTFLKPQLVDHDSNIFRPTIQSLRIPRNFDDFDLTLLRLPSQIVQPQPSNEIPFSAFRLTTVPVPPIPPLPSSPPPIPPPSSRVPKFLLERPMNLLDSPSSPTLPLVADPFQDPMD